MSRVERFIAAGFILSALCGAGLAAVYVLGGQPQIEGVLLFGSLGGIGAGLLAWGVKLMEHDVVVEEHESVASSPAEREGAAHEAEEGGETIARRPFLVRALAAALGGLGVALVFPIRSLGPNPGRSLLETAWRAGARLVQKDGTPVRVGDVPIGTILTVYPEGQIDNADSVAVLIRVQPGTLRMPQSKVDVAPNGFICYSKLCTHAGCPVGLYRQTSNQLLCPCHQSTFDVLSGAKVVFGPAPRPLPQLPIEIDAEGFVRALGDFPEAVGPAWWNRP